VSYENETFDFDYLIPKSLFLKISFQNMLVSEIFRNI